MVKKTKMTFQERMVAHTAIDKQIPDAIDDRMSIICQKLGIPYSGLLIAFNTPSFEQVTVALDENDIGKYTSLFGSHAEQQATVMGALVGAGHVAGVFKINPARQDDGSYVFSSVTDLARCVESLASGYITQENGKYANVIRAGRRQSVGDPPICP